MIIMNFNRWTVTEGSSLNLTAATPQACIVGLGTGGSWQGQWSSIRAAGGLLPLHSWSYITRTTLQCPDAPLNILSKASRLFPLSMLQRDMGVPCGGLCSSPAGGTAPSIDGLPNQPCSHHMYYTTWFLLHLELSLAVDEESPFSPGRGSCPMGGWRLGKFF